MVPAGDNNSGVFMILILRHSRGLKDFAKVPVNCHGMGGKVSFYKHHVFFCTNCRDDGRECCENHGATAKRAYLKGRCKELGLSGQGGIRINTAGCLDRCEHGPVMVIYPEETWYSYVDEEDLEEILQRHLIEGEKVDRLEI